jgi:hypothetical protein
VSADQSPFADVALFEDGFSLPELKWRELLFIGAIKPVGDHYVRDPSRPLPPFAIAGLIPEGVRLRALKQRGRIRLQRL